jgi:hypothetical protein
MLCSDHVALQATSQGHGIAQQWQAWTRHYVALSGRPVGDLPRFGFFGLIRGVSRLEFRIFPATRGLSRRTQHCRRTAGARHGVCELALSLSNDLISGMVIVLST